MKISTYEKTNDIKTVFSNTIMLYILQISKYIFPLLTFPYLTRVLQPDKYGIIVFINAVLVYFQLVIDFGFLQSGTKDCALCKDDPDKLKNTVASIVQAKLIIALLGMIVVFALSYSVKEFFDKRYFFILSYLSVFISSFSADYLFRGLQVMKIITYRTIVIKILYTILIFVFVRSTEHYMRIPIITGIGELIANIWTWWYIKKTLKINVKLVSILDTFAALKESSMFFLSRIATTAYTSSNTVILGFVYQNEALLAQYGVANTLIISIKQMFGPLADSLYPHMIQKKDYNLIRKVLLILIPIICIGVVGLFFLAEPIIIFISGNQYADSVPIFKAMLPGVLVILPSYLFGFPVLGAMGKMKAANLSVIIAAGFHIIGLCFLYITGHFTFISVALLTCATEIVVLLYRSVSIFKGRSIIKRSETTY